MTQISSKEAKDYLSRWHQVADVEMRELQSTSIHLKLRQLASLFASRSYFPESDAERDQDCTQISKRWMKIKDQFGV